MSQPFRLAAAFASLLLALGGAVAAPVAAFDPGAHVDGGSNGFTSGGTIYNFTLGFRFTTSQQLHLTELGTFDPSGTGPGIARQVGLFEFIGGAWTLRASTRFQATEQATHRVGAFSYHDIADIDLLTGHTYALMASGYHGGVQSPVFLRSHTSLSGINYGTSLYNAINAPGDAFAGPSFSSYELGPNYYTYMGANFLWDNAAAGVPEPGSLALAGLALGLVGGATRRARTSRG
ncbi:putative PEP-CTERM domain-containing protein [Rubrivivax sp. A210]|uniref:PEP-CTERM sorting domain-containing protein n=1 Tax=Rubrivivax sp. A210 TaxID=2772301 RepID=UPI00191ABE42|nr:PEP-CTERM sorting domain-containing protein [Rubrivivax sp. A210]CAD5372725.1 putative PEP-CTERM domain-containing protein [Rubrivivax sp. A210]